MQTTITLSTQKHEQLVDITSQIESIVTNAKVKTGMINVYVQGATAGIMIQENWDDSVQNDVLSWLRKMIPHGVWEHDA